ncbi:MAG: 50S ribosomal protein L10 [Deltaproteobacteria bacterium]|nr:50S ribosomal protein L10 [Deltaproteobacteria bacterium]
MEKSEKEIFIGEMKSRLKKAKATFLVDYQGLDVEAMNRLRGELRKIDVEFQVTKNRLLKLASQDTDSEVIKEKFVGPCAIALTYNDVVGPAKVLVDLSKELQNMELKTGQISGKPMDVDAIKRLAALPGRDQLIAQALSAMQEVPTSFVRALNGVILNFMYVLKAIENSKGNE